MTDEDHSGAVALVNFLQKEAHLKRQSELIEKELQERLVIVKEHHRTYARIATHYVKLLQKAAEDHAFIYRALSPPAVTQEEHPPRFVDPTESPTRANRLVVVPPAASGSKVSSSLQLTARPQIHSKIVAERRLERDVEEEKRRLRQYADSEARRTDAYARKQQMILDQIHERDDRVKHVKDWSKVQVDREREAREHRERVREKHDTIQRNREVAILERQAATSAIRKLDDMARNSLAQSKKQAHTAHSLCAAGALYVQQSNNEDRAFADRSVHEARTTRHIAKSRFVKEFKTSMEKTKKGIHRDEHHASVEYVKKLQASPAVQVEWPRDVLTVEGEKKRSPIKADQYMRLCGARHLMHSDLDGDNELSIDTMRSLQHIAPAQWKLIKSAQPDPKWEALQRVQASTIQGPKHVRWQ